MGKVRLINIADVNCWMVYLMPFHNEERKNYELVNDFQQKCIDKKLFGMGWGCPLFEFGTQISEENAELYKKEYNRQHEDKVSENAVKLFQQVKKGDFVVMRMKNSHFYVGRVKTDKVYYMHKEDSEDVFGRLSWGGEVDEWIEYTNEMDIPSEIVGRFSQRLHSTIVRIGDYRSKMLVVAMYEKDKGNKVFNIPKLHINENNYVRSLNYKELEDLVAMHIVRKNDGYILLPSSCKVNQQKYEFIFINKERKMITCQVKNQNAINVEQYLGDNDYEKVYLFSGVWSNQEVKKLTEKYKDSNVYFISPKELYKTLVDEKIFANDFYSYDKKSIDVGKIHQIDGFNKCTQLRSDSSYKIDGDYIYFARKGLYYSVEFESLILEWHFKTDDERDKEKEIIKKVTNSLSCIVERIQS